MILNVSYHNPSVSKKIDAEVGSVFTLRQRLNLQGIGSPRMPIIEASIQINNLLILDNNQNVCNIELRPRGILVGFRSLLESYVLVIPFYKLSIYKGGATQYTIYRDTYFVKINAAEATMHRFIQKILDYKISQSSSNSAF